MNSIGNGDTKQLIVLIDDEPSVLLALKLLLGALGFQVREFSKPREAVDYLAEGGACDFIMSDLRMPGLDGMDVLEETRRSRPELPFILISGHATSEEISKARSLGASGFIGKPFTPDQLKEAIASVQEGAAI